MPERPDRLQLAPVQQALFEALVDRQPNLGEWYRAAVAVINDDGLPDRHALAAHALREVMDKLPGDGFRVAQGPPLAEKVRQLRPPWTRAIEERQLNGGAWNDAIGPSLTAFLVASEGFFNEQDRLFSERRQVAVAFLNSLDLIPGGLPPDVQQQNAQEWMTLRGYFTGVAHHGVVEDESFRLRVNRLEGFLSSRLIPRPTDDLSAIDALLEGE